MTQEQLETQFTHHTPDPSQIARTGTIRAYGLAFASTVLLYTPACADQAAAIRKIREAVMTANAAVVLEDGVVDVQANAGEIETLQANAWGSFWNWLKGIFGAKAEQTATDFVKLVTSDLLPLAETAVQVVEAKMQGAAGADKLAAAKVAFVAAAKSAGTDLEGFAASALNCFLEIALQAVMSKAASVAAAAITAGADEQPKATS